MAPCQILVSGLYGKTLGLQVRFSHSITGTEVGARVAPVTSIPQECQRLVTETGEIRFEMCLAGLVVGDDGMLPSCSVVLRLRDGKGDFGSLLREAATKAGQKKTSNFRCLSRHERPETGTSELRRGAQGVESGGVGETARESG
jgi:hypothetical protein